MGINQMIDHTRKQGVKCGLQVYGNALIHRARNEALTRSDPSSTHVLFVDDDMLPAADALLRLLAAKKPVISALCTTRAYHDLRIAAKAYDPERETFGALENVNVTKVVSGPFAPGTAFLLIDRPTITKLVGYYLSAEDWLDENTKQLSRMAVRVERREAERVRMAKVRKQQFDDSGLIRVFDFPVNDDQLQLGEDICLGRKLLNLGIEVAIDGTTIVGHLGEYPYTVGDVIRREQDRIEHVRSL